MVLKLFEISKKYNIALSTLNSAIEAKAFPVLENSIPKRVDTEGEQFLKWLEARKNQSRVKGDLSKMEALAVYAAHHQIEREGIGKFSTELPLKVLFSILDDCINTRSQHKSGTYLNLKIAKERSIKEIAELTKVSSEVAEEYVNLFYTLLGDGKPKKADIVNFLNRERALAVAYDNSLPKGTEFQLQRILHSLGLDSSDEGYEEDSES